MFCDFGPMGPRGLYHVHVAGSGKQGRVQTDGDGRESRVQRDWVGHHGGGQSRHRRHRLGGVGCLGWGRDVMMGCRE